ncbi:MAG: hypothetical protein HQL19_07775 [Candidatus Omnitrophica bacterium]|nr:hypothetical protein [Candidatus Omnitrophota bacterium]
MSKDEKSKASELVAARAVIAGKDQGITPMEWVQKNYGIVQDGKDGDTSGLQQAMSPLHEEALKYSTPEDFSKALEYHGTSEENAAKIAQEGFKVGNGQEGVSTTQDATEALDYGKKVIPVLIKHGSEMAGKAGKDFLTGTGSWNPKDLLHLPEGTKASDLHQIWNEAHALLQEDVRDIQKRFSDHVDGWLSGDISKEKWFSFKASPQIFRLLGTKVSNIIVGNRILEKATTGKHNVTVNGFKQLPDQMSRPVMVFKSKSNGSDFVFLTEVKDKSGRSVILPVYLQKSNSGWEIAHVTNYFGKDYDSAFVGWMGEGLLRYYDKKKVQDWLVNSPSNTRERVNHYLDPTKVYTETDLNPTLFQQDSISKDAIDNSHADLRVNSEKMTKPLHEMTQDEFDRLPVVRYMKQGLSEKIIP